jgi:hypothetical protein
MTSASNVSVLSLPGGGSVAQFDARQTQVKLANLEGDLVRFRQLKDWPKLEEAADAKIAEQASFVANWDGVVTGNRHNVNPRPENADRHFLSVSQAEELWGITQPTVSKWRAALKDTERYRARIILGAFRAATLEPAENHRAEGTGENEWFTPPEHVAAARSVLGAIDLDPATNPIAQETVRATNHYTRKDDALTKPWEGRVWLNPPYAQPLIGQFVEKLVGEFAAGRVTQAIMLTHNYTDTAWFHLAAATASLICFTKGRIRFVNAEGEPCSPTQGQALFYYGTDGGEEFRKAYSAFGLVMRHA